VANTYENKFQSEEVSHGSTSSIRMNDIRSIEAFRSRGRSMTIRVANLRSGPTTRSTIMVQLPINSSIYINKTLGDWVKIDYHGLSEQDISDLAFYKKLCDSESQLPSLSPVISLDSPCKTYTKLLYSQSPKSWVGWLHKSSIVE
jgi:hypothetical protein